MAIVMRMRREATAKKLFKFGEGIIDSSARNKWLNYGVTTIFRPISLSFWFGVSPPPTPSIRDDGYDSSFIQYKKNNTHTHNRYPHNYYLSSKYSITVPTLSLLWVEKGKQQKTLGLK